jgi:prepilin-type N-terminal cleavage/methylation domain-containing protein
VKDRELKIEDWKLKIADCNFTMSCRCTPNFRFSVFNFQSSIRALWDRPSRRSRHEHRGVSLLEVLISIFVLSIGLLGVAAMIPVGRFEIVEAAKADRSAVVGRAAMRDVMVRRMAEPMQWTCDTTPSYVSMWFSASGAYTPGYEYVLIDPLYCSQVGYGRFPANATYGMTRVNLRSGPLSGSTAMDVNAAREIFLSHDDVIFELPKEKGERARLQYRNRSTNLIDTAPGSYNPATAVPDYEGNYSWMVMVSPSPSEVALSNATDRYRATVSVVVFYKRDLSADGEQVAEVAFTGGGLGGGDVQLTATNAAHLERLRKNEWVMLCGQNSSLGNTYQWYRVVAVSNPPNAATTLTRNVSLVGPDWSVTNYPNASTRATLIGGVVGVYTRTIELSRDLMRGTGSSSSN